MPPRRRFRCLDRGLAIFRRSAGVLMALGLTAVLALPAAAQLTGLTGGDEPVEIEANGALEWLSNEQRYRATGGVRVRSGDVELRTGEITADYVEPEEGGQQITTVTASGGVRIETSDVIIIGTTGVYRLGDESFILTGDALSLETGTDLVTATESLEYYQQEGLAIARGNVVVVRGDQQVEADEIVAELIDVEGSQELSVVEATGNVRVSSPDGVATAEVGIYDAIANIAQLAGTVRITRGQTQLSGDMAEVNLTTGVSRLISDPDGEGRIRGLLTPQDAEGLGAGSLLAPQ
ncbi:MAG: LptA/OstA family protein [Azospirillaceae bacterium]